MRSANLEWFTRRLPSLDDVKVASGVTVFIIFSWSIRGFLYQFPSLILRFRLADVFGVFTYMMSVALFESLFIVLLLVFASAIFPPTWFRIGFSYKASVTIIVGSLEMIRFQNVMKYSFPLWSTIWMHFGITFVVLILLILILHYVKPLQKAMNFIVERFLVFLSIYPPVGVISVIVVILRNIN